MVVVPVFANVFNLVSLDKTQWIYTIAISILPIPIMELQKKLNEFTFGKVIYGYTSIEKVNVISKK